MRIAILSCGAVVAKEADQVWLFGAPEGVDIGLKEAGIDVPRFVFLTGLRAPGYTSLGTVVSFKEKPLNISGLGATPIEHKHGTDYAIEAQGARVLFSERGDVAARDLEGYDLCIVKNKHRGDSWDESIVTWPWPDAEYSIADHSLEEVGAAYKVYSKMGDVPDRMKTHKGAKLSLSQVNWVVSIAEGIPEGKVDEPYAVAWGKFAKNYHIESGHWVKNKGGERKKELKLKVWSDIEKVPSNIRTIDGAELTLDQANAVARMAEAAGEDGKENWAVAVEQFKNAYEKQGDAWVEKVGEGGGEEMKREKSLNKIRQRFENAFSRQFPRGPNGPYCYVVDVDLESDMVVVSEDSGFYFVPYTETADSIVFAQRGEWQPAVQEYVAEAYAPVRIDYAAPSGMGYGYMEKELLPLADRGRAWDASAAELRVRKWASSDGSGDKDKVNWGKYGRAFFKKGGEGKLGDYKLPFADIVDGKLTAIPQGIIAVAQVLQGARGGADLGGGEGSIKSAVASYYAKMRSEIDGFDRKAPWEKKEKELTDEGPVRRLGDMLVADLHTAYNNFADDWYRQGYMDEDERKQVGGAIGEALKALRASLSKELQDRVLGGPVAVPTAMKELAPGMPDEVVDSWQTVYKSDDGKWHWASVTSSAVWDGHGELVTPEAMTWAVNVAKVIGAGPLRFKHAPGLDGGDCTHQSVAGGLLFEKGDFHDNRIGQAMRKALQKDPTGWKISPGLAFSRKDLVGGVYRKVMIFERSMTKEPANSTTAILTDGGATEMAILKQLSEDELAQVAKDLDLSVGYVTKLHQQALTNGNEVAGLKEFKEFVEKEASKSRKAKKGADEEENMADEAAMEEEEEMKRTKAKQIVAGLDAEARKELRTLLEETEPPEVKLQAEVTELKEMVTAQNETMERLMTLLAGTLGGRNKEAEVEETLNTLLGQLPRRQAAQFASKELGHEPDEADNEVMALLKEIRGEVLKSQGNQFAPGGNIYDAFTSKRLNPPARES